jgi:hypothetical protein
MSGSSDAISDWRSCVGLTQPEDRSTTWVMSDSHREERLTTDPAKPRSLLAVLATLEPLDEAFPAIPELELDPVEL